MLRSAAVAEVQTGLGFRTDLDTLIIARMQRVQRLLEMGGTLPWFLIKEGQLVSVAAGDDGYLPDDFIREVESGQGGLYFSDSTNSNRPVYLRKMDKDEAFQVYGVENTTSDYPVAYVMQSDRFKLYKQPTSAMSLYLDYYGKDDILDSNIENKWLKYAPDVIIGNAGASVAKTLRNQSAQAEFEELARTAWARVLAETVLRQTSNHNYVIGRNG